MAAIFSLPNLHRDPIRSLVECTVESVVRSFLPYLPDGYKFKYSPYPVYDASPVKKSILSDQGFASEIGHSHLSKARLVITSRRFDDIETIANQPLLKLVDTAWVRLLTMYVRSFKRTPFLKMSQSMEEPNSRTDGISSFCLPVILVHRTTKNEMILNVGFDQDAFQLFVGLRVPWFCPPRECYGRRFIAPQTNQDDISSMLESKNPNYLFARKVCTPDHFEELLVTAL